MLGEPPPLVVLRLPVPGLFDPVADQVELERRLVGGTLDPRAAHPPEPFLPLLAGDRPGRGTRREVRGRVAHRFTTVRPDGSTETFATHGPPPGLSTSS